MRRREFCTVVAILSLLIGGVSAWSLAARAQSPAMPVIGFLNVASPGAFSTFLAAFHQGLNSGGYVEGRNVSIEYRWADGDFNLLREQAADLARRQVALIVATGGLVSARAAKDATDTIPVLFIGGADPVGEGLVTSLNRPGGNATGVNLYASELSAKRLELLRELVPKADKFAVLLNPKTRAAPLERPDLEKAAQTVGLQLLVLEASTENELKTAFDSAAATGVGAIIVSNDGFFTSRRAQIVELAASHRLPVVYGSREYAVAGGLMSYGPNIRDAYRQIGDYTGRVLKGVKPGDLPVRQPTKFDLILNLKTAKSLGLEVPYPLLITANEVIE
jgi:putative tryptophan/tyrosine transport system substrate-binding protein